MLKLSVEQLAGRLGGRVHGDARECTVRSIATLSCAGDGDVAVLRSDAFRADAVRCRASVLVTAEEVDGFAGIQVLVDDPEAALADLLEMVHRQRFRDPVDGGRGAGVSPDALLGLDVVVGRHSVIEAGARIGDGCILHPMVFIGRDAVIGDHTVIYPHAAIMSSTRIGRDCVIRPHAVIGDEGFGIARSNGRRLRHVGGVRIGDRVEIGSFTSIDRGMLDDTVIGSDCKIDKHCMIAHNCTIGNHCILAGYARMAGSVQIGDGAVLAADVHVKDHVTIGDRAVVAASTGVTRNVEPGEVVWGMPTRDLKTQTRIYALEGRLPELFKRVRELEKRAKGDSA